MFITGTASCEFLTKKQRSNSYDRPTRYDSESTRYYGSDILLNSKVTLFPRGVIPAGVHSYNFECFLPTQLPASFEAKHGSIRYEVKSKLDIPWAIDKEGKRPFTVARVDDLNLDPRMRLPIANEERKPIYWCIFCRGDPCIITVKVPQSGYASGELLKYKLDLDNRSNVDISDSRITFVRVISYVSSNPRRNMKFESRELYYRSTPGVDSGEIVSYDGQFEIPRFLSSSNSHICRSVTISYELRIEVVPTKCLPNFTIATPITIGAIPLRSAAELQQMQQTVVPSAPVQQGPIIVPQHIVVQSPAVPSSPQTIDKDSLLPPPSFEEAMLMNKHEKLDDSNDQK